VIVPVTGVSRLTECAISEALSIGSKVIAVNVVLDGGPDKEAREKQLLEAWDRWDPGVPLRVLRTDFAGVVGPIVAFIDEYRDEHDEQIVVLIPVVVPDRVRYRFLHNQIDLVLSRALRSRTDVVVARVRVQLEALSRASEAPTAL
jgi:hypothetical protein